ALPHAAPRAADAPGVLGTRQALRDARGHPPPGAVAPRAASCIRNAPAEPWRRPARRAIAARSCRHHDDDDLHARRARAAEAPARAAPSARLAMIDSIANRAAFIPAG